MYCVSACVDCDVMRDACPVYLDYRTFLVGAVVCDGVVHVSGSACLVCVRVYCMYIDISRSPAMCGRLVGWDSKRPHSGPGQAHHIDRYRVALKRRRKRFD